MNDDRWVVAAVGQSRAAKRTDSCGDMEQLEAMEYILVSEHDTRQSAEDAAAAKRAAGDDRQYTVMPRRDYEASVGATAPRAG